MPNFAEIDRLSVLLGLVRDYIRALVALKIDGDGQAAIHRPGEPVDFLYQTIFVFRACREIVEFNQKVVFCEFSQHAVAPGFGASTHKAKLIELQPFARTPESCE